MTGDRYRAGKRLWSPADDRALRRQYPHVPTATLARPFRRSATAIHARAATLGLHKSAAYLASPAACRLRRGDHVGASTRYVQGHIPANKGLRRPGWSAGRMRETQFKPGVLNGVAAQRFLPIGSTRLADGYLWRKVSATPGTWTANWTMEHVLVWTAAHGPVPPGHVLTFRNGDRTDVRLDNLDVISRRDLMARNSVHTLPKPLAAAVQLLGALNRKINRRTRDDAHDRRSA